MSGEGRALHDAVVDTRLAVADERLQWDIQKMRYEHEHARWAQEREFYLRGGYEPRSGTPAEEGIEAELRTAMIRGMKELSADERKLELVRLQVCEEDERQALVCEAAETAWDAYNALECTLQAQQQDNLIRTAEAYKAHAEDLDLANAALEANVEQQRARLDQWEREELRLATMTELLPSGGGGAGAGAAEPAAAASPIPPPQLSVHPPHPRAIATRGVPQAFEAVCAAGGGGGVGSPARQLRGYQGNLFSPPRSPGGEAAAPPLEPAAAGEAGARDQPRPRGGGDDDAVKTQERANWAARRALARERLKRRRSLSANPAELSVERPRAVLPPASPGGVEAPPPVYQPPPPPPPAVPKLQLPLPPAQPQGGLVPAAGGGVGMRGASTPATTVPASAREPSAARDGRPPPLTLRILRSGAVGKHARGGGRVSASPVPPPPPEHAKCHRGVSRSRSPAATAPSVGTPQWRPVYGARGQHHHPGHDMISVSDLPEVWTSTAGSTCITRSPTPNIDAAVAAAAPASPRLPCSPPASPRLAAPSSYTFDRSEVVTIRVESWGVPDAPVALTAAGGITLTFQGEDASAPPIPVRPLARGVAEFTDVLLARADEVDAAGSGTITAVYPKYGVHDAAVASVAVVIGGVDLDSVDDADYEPATPQRRREATVSQQQQQQQQFSPAANANATNAPFDPAGNSCSPRSLTRHRRAKTPRRVIRAADIEYWDRNPPEVMAAPLTGCEPAAKRGGRGRGGGVDQGTAAAAAAAATSAEASAHDNDDAAGVAAPSSPSVVSSTDPDAIAAAQQRSDQRVEAMLAAGGRALHDNIDDILIRHGVLGGASVTDTTFGDSTGIETREVPSTSSIPTPFPHNSNAPLRSAEAGGADDSQTEQQQQQQQHRLPPSRSVAMFTPTTHADAVAAAGGSGGLLWAAAADGARVRILQYVSAEASDAGGGGGTGAITAHGGGGEGAASEAGGGDDNARVPGGGCRWEHRITLETILAGDGEEEEEEDEGAAGPTKEPRIGGVYWTSRYIAVATAKRELILWEQRFINAWFAFAKRLPRSTVRHTMPYKIAAPRALTVYRDRDGCTDEEFIFAMHGHAAFAMYSEAHGSGGDSGCAHVYLKAWAPRASVSAVLAGAGAHCPAVDVLDIAVPLTPPSFIPSSMHFASESPAPSRVPPPPVGMEVLQVVCVFPYVFVAWEGGVACWSPAEVRGQNYSPRRHRRDGGGVRHGTPLTPSTVRREGAPAMHGSVDMDPDMDIDVLSHNSPHRYATAGPGVAGGGPASVDARVVGYRCDAAAAAAAAPPPDWVANRVRPGSTVVVVKDYQLSTAVGGGGKRAPKVTCIAAVPALLEPGWMIAIGTHTGGVWVTLPHGARARGDTIDDSLAAARLWPCEVFPFARRSSGVTDIAFALHGKVLVCCAATGVAVYDVARRALIHSLHPPPAGGVIDVAGRAPSAPMYRSVAAADVTGSLLATTVPDAAAAVGASGLPVERLPFDQRLQWWGGVENVMAVAPAGAAATGLPSTTPLHLGGFSLAVLCGRDGPANARSTSTRALPAGHDGYIIHGRSPPTPTPTPTPADGEDECDGAAAATRPGFFCKMSTPMAAGGGPSGGGARRSLLSPPRVDGEGPKPPPPPHGYIGMRVKETTPAGRGVSIVHVHARGPADTAGIRVDDVVIGVGVHTVDTARDFARAVRTLPPGSPVRVCYLRGGVVCDVDVAVVDKAAGSGAHDDATEEGVVDTSRYGASSPNNLPRYNSGGSLGGGSAAGAGLGATVSSAGLGTGVLSASTMSVTSATLPQVRVRGGTVTRGGGGAGAGMPRQLPLSRQGSRGSNASTAVGGGVSALRRSATTTVAPVAGAGSTNTNTSRRTSSRTSSMKSLTVTVSGTLDSDGGGAAGTAKPTPQQRRRRRSSGGSDVAAAAAATAAADPPATAAPSGIGRGVLHGVPAAPASSDSDDEYPTPQELSSASPNGSDREDLPSGDDADGASTYASAGRHSRTTSRRTATSSDGEGTSRRAGRSGSSSSIPSYVSPSASPSFASTYATGLGMSFASTTLGYAATSFNSDGFNLRAAAAAAAAAAAGEENMVGGRARSGSRRRASSPMNSVLPSTQAPPLQRVQGEEARRMVSVEAAPPPRAVAKPRRHTVAGTTRGRSAEAAAVAPGGSGSGSRSAHPPRGASQSHGGVIFRKDRDRSSTHIDTRPERIVRIQSAGGSVGPPGVMAGGSHLAPLAAAAAATAAPSRSGSSGSEAPAKSALKKHNRQGPGPEGGARVGDGLHLAPAGAATSSSDAEPHAYVLTTSDDDHPDPPVETTDLTAFDGTSGRGMRTGEPGGGGIVSTSATSSGSESGAAASSEAPAPAVRLTSTDSARTAGTQPGGSSKRFFSGKAKTTTASAAAEPTASSSRLSTASTSAGGGGTPGGVKRRERARTSTGAAGGRAASRTPSEAGVGGPRTRARRQTSVSPTPSRAGDAPPSPGVDAAAAIATFTPEEQRQLSTDTFGGMKPLARLQGFLAANSQPLPTPATEATLRTAVVTFIQKCRRRKTGYVDWWKLTRPPPSRR